MRRKEVIYLLYSLLNICFLTSCDKADDANDWKFNYPAPSFDTTTDLGKLQKELYDTYQVSFLSDFDETFYRFDWASTFDTLDKIEVAANDHTYTVQYLQEVKKVLEKMPAFLLENLPSHILLVDSLKNTYGISYNATTIDSPIRAIVADSKTNFVVFSFCGKSFPLQDINELRESWTEILFERALSTYTAPEEFQNIILAQKNGKIVGYALTSSWKSTYNMSQYGFLEDSYRRRTRIISGYANAKGDLTELKYAGDMKENQDLALFIAFSMYRPSDKKADIYAKGDVYAQKEEIVKDFCLHTLGFELKSLVTD